MSQRKVLLVTLVMLVAPSVSAQLYTSGDWYWSDQDPDFYFAATKNSSNHVLGQYCYFKSASCVYLVGLGVDCEIGDEYAALVNSDAGSAHISLACTHQYENRYILGIYPFEDIDKVVRKANDIGIVIPLEGDEFKVGRFSLRGSVNALDRMREAAKEKMSKNPTPTNKPDEEYL